MIRRRVRTWSVFCFSITLAKIACLLPTEIFPRPLGGPNTHTHTHTHTHTSEFVVAQPYPLQERGKKAILISRFFICSNSLTFQIEDFVRKKLLNLKKKKKIKLVFCIFFLKNLRSTFKGGF